MTYEQLTNKLKLLNKNQLNELYKYSSYIDHTLLKADANDEEITNLCNEARVYKFKSVCINPCRIKFAKNILKNSDVLICSVVGFPLGQNSSLSKAYEALIACNDGADEIDMVINIDDLKNKRNTKIVSEVNEVKKACGGKILKVIVETSLLSEADKLYAMEILTYTHADFIKTSTGFSTSGAKLEDIIMWNNWRQSHPTHLLIKAAGGIKTGNDLIKFIKAGSDRIGTSRSVSLIDELFNLNKKANKESKSSLGLDKNIDDSKNY